MCKKLFGLCAVVLFVFSFGCQSVKQDDSKPAATEGSKPEQDDQFFATGTAFISKPTMNKDVNEGLNWVLAFEKAFLEARLKLRERNKISSDVPDGITVRKCEVYEDRIVVTAEYSQSNQDLATEILKGGLNLKAEAKLPPEIIEQLPDIPNDLSQAYGCRIVYDSKLEPWIVVSGMGVLVSTTSRMSLRNAEKKAILKGVTFVSGMISPKEVTKIEENGVTQRIVKSKSTQYIPAPFVEKKVILEQGKERVLVIVGALKIKKPKAVDNNVCNDVATE